VRAAFALIPLLLAGCAPQVVTVAEVLAHCDAYKGKFVHVAGYLADCGGYDCGVFRNKSHWSDFRKAWADEQRIDNADRKANDAAWARIRALWPMGVGFDSGVEPKLTAHNDRYVIIAGRIDKSSCDGSNGMDRSEGIHPADVRVWTKAAGAPADADDNTPFRNSTTLH
jgi:hypothetical protein